MATDTATPDLLNKILQRTREGRVHWEMDHDDDGIPFYSVGIANIRVAVKELELGFGGYNKGDPEFIVYDADGAELDSITTMTDGGLWNVELLDLARLARLSARGAPGKYAAALEKLDDRTG